MADIKYKTNFDIYANVAKIEKNEISMRLFETQEKLNSLNEQIRILKEKISEHEFKVRSFADINGENIELSEYQLIRLNILDLSEKVETLREDEVEVKQKHTEESEELDKKRLELDKLVEKQIYKRHEISVSVDKKEAADMDDLWGQNNWVNHHE